MSTPQAAAARLWRTLGCLAMAALLAACTAQGSPALTGTPGGRPGSHGPGGGATSHGTGTSSAGMRPQITVGPTPPAGSGPTIVMPLDAYEQIAAQEQDTGLAAFGLLTQRCMQVKGFSYPLAPQRAGSQAALAAIERQPIGITSLAQAKAHGYGKPGGMDVPSGRIGLSVFPVFLTLKELSHRPAAWLSALSGDFVPGGLGTRRGCIQTVQSQLDQGLGGFADPVPELAAQAAQWAQSDPRVLPVQRSWSRCMAAAGYSYQTPQQAATHHWPKKPTPAEIATATADVSCKTQTNLPNTVLTIEAAYQQALISQNPAAFAHLQTAFRVLLQRAKNLLGQPASLHTSPAGTRPHSASRPLVKR